MGGFAELSKMPSRVGGGAGPVAAGTEDKDRSITLIINSLTVIDSGRLS